MICALPPALPGLYSAPRLVLLEPRKWRKRRLHVRFLDGEDWQRQRIADIICGPEGWNSACGLQFVFDQAEQADIRISLAPGASWSHPGSYAAELPQAFPSMQIAWAVADGEGDIQRVTLHEFGHALGFEHEHTNPAARLPWIDRAQIYDYFQRVYGWDKERVDAQVLAQLDPSVTEYSEFDAQSVMGYTLSGELMTDGVEITGGHVLSSIDRVMASAWYGLPPERWRRTYLPGITK